MDHQAAVGREDPAQRIDQRVDERTGPGRRVGGLAEGEPVAVGADHLGRHPHLQATFIR